VAERLNDGEAVNEGVGDTEGVELGLGDGDGVDDALGEREGVDVGLGVSDRVTLGLAERDGVAEALAEGVAVKLGLEDVVTVGEALGVTVAVAGGRAVKVGETVGLGEFSSTWMAQTSALSTLDGPSWMTIWPLEFGTTPLKTLSSALLAPPESA
jgi:hypothetical protein